MFLFRSNDPNYFKRVKFKTARDIVTIWRGTLNKCKSSFFHDKLPLWENPGLPEIFHDGVGKRWSNLGIKPLRDLFDSRGLMTFETLKILYNLTESMRFKYYQIRNYFAHNMSLTEAPVSDIWDCLYLATNKSLISIGYKCFNSYKEDDCTRLAERWSQRMGTNVTNQAISSAFSRIYRSIHSTNLRLQQHRTICSLYYTPEKIAK